MKNNKTVIWLIQIILSPIVFFLLFNFLRTPGLPGYQDVSATFQRSNVSWEIIWFDFNYFEPVVWVIWSVVLFLIYRWEKKQGFTKLEYLFTFIWAFVPILLWCVFALRISLKLMGL